MIEVILSLLSASLLSCVDGYWIIDGINKAEGIKDSTRVELIAEVKSAMPDKCNRGDYELRSR